MPASTLQSYLRDLQRQLRRAVPKALDKYNADAVHDARVTTRRLKAAVDAFRPLLSDHVRKSFEKTLRRLRKRFGPLRDFDMMLKHVKEIASDGRHVAASSWCARQLRDQRKDARDDIADEKSDLLKWANAVGHAAPWSDVRDAGAKSGEILARSSVQLLADFAAQADRFAVAHAAGGEAYSEKPHTVRKAAKLLRYTLEIAAEAGHPIPDDASKSFKQLQDALGLWHDWAVLTQRLLTLAAEDDLASSNPALFGQILELGRETWSRAGKNLEEFVRLWRELGPGLTEQIPRALSPAPIPTPAPLSAEAAATAAPAAPESPAEESNASEPSPVESAEESNALEPAPAEPAAIEPAAAESSPPSDDSAESQAGGSQSETVVTHEMNEAGAT